MFLRISFFPLALDREDPEIESNNTLHNKVKIIESNIERCVKWIFTWNWVRCSEIAKAYTSRPSCRPCNHVFFGYFLAEGYWQSLTSPSLASGSLNSISRASWRNSSSCQSSNKMKLKYSIQDKDLTNWMQITSPSPTSDSRESSFSPTLRAFNQIFSPPPTMEFPLWARPWSPASSARCRGSSRGGRPCSGGRGRHCQQGSRGRMEGRQSGGTPCLN